MHIHHILQDQQKVAGPLNPANPDLNADTGILGTGLFDVSFPVTSGPLSSNCHLLYLTERWIPLFMVIQTWLNKLFSGQAWDHISISKWISTPKLEDINPNISTVHKVINLLSPKSVTRSPRRKKCLYTTNNFVLSAVPLTCKTSVLKTSSNL